MTDKTDRSGDKKIKVLRVIARLNTGGPATHVILLNSGLDKKRFTSYLAAGSVSRGERDMTPDAKKVGIKPFIIPELKREISLKDDLAAFFKIYRLMRRLKPDIVHTHTAKAGALGRVAAMLINAPIKIHTFHGHIFHSYFGRLKSKIFLGIERILAHFTTRIVVISEKQLSEIRDRYKIAPEGKYSVIPLGLNLEQFLTPSGKRDLRKELSIDEDTLLVGIVGRLVRVKNHKMFLEAAERIKIKYPHIKVKFLIVGDGPLRGELERYTKKLGMEDSVIFIGWRANLSALYESLDIACLTSLNEGTPISLIEAMASGKAVLSTDVGGVRDVITHNESGLLSPSGDVEGFSRNLSELLQDKKERQGIGENARAFVTRRFSKERLIRDTEVLYDQELKKVYGSEYNRVLEIHDMEV
ncbi:MAG: glycosyltransferase family 4 protein [Candidatus Omnitrophica bacterium]|nr:glycosyltransferase family 4 protein [Candidatus Omnitrophota bacterium]